MEALKRHVHQTKKEAFEASNKWQKKYITDIGKYMKETVEMKRMLAEKINLAEISIEHQALQSAYQYLHQEFERQRHDFVALREEYHCHVAQREELIGHLRMVDQDWRGQSY